MKTTKRLRSKKGFTLVECMVAIAIFAIMAAIVMQMLALCIKLYARNDRVDKDLDKQIESLVKMNDTDITDRGTFDLMLDFLGGSLSVNNISIISNINDTDERMELDTMTAEIPPASGSGGAEWEEGDGGGSSKPSDGQSMMASSECHVYGTSAIQGVTVTEDSATPNADGTEVDVALTVEILTPDQLLSRSFAQSIKVALPTGSKIVSANTDGKAKIYVLGRTVRISDNKLSDKETSYKVSFTARMPIDSYNNVYKSFANYFIEKDSTLPDKYVTLHDSETPGLYNKR